jgi:hypothetical protein
MNCLGVSAMANLDHVTGIGGKARAKAIATLHRGMDRTSKAFAVAAGVVAAALSDLNNFPVDPARISRISIFWARFALLVFPNFCEGRLMWPPFAGQLRPLKSSLCRRGIGFGLSIGRIGSIASSWALVFPVLLPLQEMGWMISVSQGEVFIGQV